jgi:hypothetical protein
MNLKAIALAAILGLSTPMIADLTLNTPALAQSNLPIGIFEDSQWAVTLQYTNNALTYIGSNKRTGDYLELRGARVSGNAQRRLYIWRNGDYTYQVAWRPSDSGYIRLQVFDGRGREILNRLLSRTSWGD